MTDYVLPDGVERGDAGVIQFLTQRIDTRPFVNCLMYVGAMLVEYGGLVVPKDFGMQLRVASGVPMGDHIGTSVGDLRRGLAKLLPFVHVDAGAKSETDFLDFAGTGQALGVIVNFAKVPAGVRLRDFVGSFQGKHCVLIAGYMADVQKVFVYDPMAPARHEGRWLRWSSLSPYLSRQSTGEIRTFWITKGQALEGFPVDELEVLRGQVATLTGENSGLNQMVRLATDQAAHASQLLASAQSQGSALAGDLRSAGAAITALADRAEALGKETPVV